MKNIINKIMPIIKKSKGTFGIVIKNMENSDGWQINENKPFKAASIIKIPIMVAAFKEAENGRINLNDKICIKESNKVGGSGVLQFLTPDIQLSILDIIILMIIVSDNTAANILIDLIGIKKIRKLMYDCGMKDSFLDHKLMEKSNQPNQITAHDVAILLEKIINGEIISSTLSKKVVAIMLQQQLRDNLPGKTQFQNNIKWKFANKTGWIPGYRHDAGIYFYNTKQIIVVVLSKDLDDYNSKLILAQIGETIFKSFAQNE